MTTLGQVGLCTTRGKFSRLIRAVTHSTYNHSVVGLGDGYNVSAEPGGVCIHTDAYWPGLVYTNLDMTPAQAAKSAHYALSREGTPYAWGDDILIGIALELHDAIPMPLLRHIADDGHLQCSELCDLSLRRAGVSLFPNIPAGAVYPGMFAPFLEES